MDKIFALRRKTWQAQNIKYLRYVFNDHFSLFLLILLGAIAVQYAQFLQVYSFNLWQKVVLIILVSLLAILPGRLATFVEAPDKVFLLVQEQKVREQLIFSLVRSMFLPAFVALVLVLISAPLLKFSIVIFVAWYAVLLLLKALLFWQRLRIWQPKGNLQWDLMIQYEENRKASILRFFALFTTVKGLKTHSHRRKYLDFLLPKTKRTYEYILSRSFLRSGDYLGLTVRLLVLSILALIFVKNPILAVILVCVLNALLVFQLLALRDAVDYQLFTKIYPVKKTAKNSGVRRILSRLVSFLTLVELLFALLFLSDKPYALVILVVNFLLVKVYIKSRLKK